jgi:transporter family-2 protein
VKNVYILMAVMAGAALPIQASINAEFAARGATPLWAAGFSAALTAVTLAVIATVFIRVPVPSLAVMGQIPLWLWCGGFLGVLVLGVMSSVPQRIGAATMIVCFIAGQTLCSLVLDHFGWLGLPQQSISTGRLAGAALIVAGVALVRLF